MGLRGNWICGRLAHDKIPFSTDHITASFRKYSRSALISIVWLVEMTLTFGNKHSRWCIKNKCSSIMLKIMPCFFNLIQAWVMSPFCYTYSTGCQLPMLILRYPWLSTLLAGSLNQSLFSHSQVTKTSKHCSWITSYTISCMQSVSQSPTHCPSFCLASGFSNMVILICGSLVKMSKTFCVKCNNNLVKILTLYEGSKHLCRHFFLYLGVNKCVHS